jgi:hypothetical protein
MKSLIKPLIFIGVLAGAFVGLCLSGFVPLDFNPFKKKEIEILDTGLQVDEIKQVAKLFTQQYVNEILYEDTHKTPGFFGGSTDKLVMIVKGKVYAGTDLSKMKQEDIIIIDSANCEVKIPKAEILSTICNPSDYQTFISEGYWKTNLKAYQKAKDKARKKLELLAKKDDILKKADKKSVSVMMNFMQSLGYKNVNVIIK